MNNSQKEMQELIDKLNYYTKLYDEGKPEISDKEWDNLYFKLESLENEYGYSLPGSPTHFINYDVVNKLEKVTHNHNMLSLPKTKIEKEVLDFIGNQTIIAMCKMDGLTCSLMYKDGKLISAETRGNGIVGENIFHNAVHIKSIPKVIDYTEDLIIDGEIICTYENFKDFENDYKNPRNFASGSIRLLDAREASKRNLDFVAWEVIKGYNDIDSLTGKLNYIKNLGFITVPFIQMYEDNNISKVNTAIYACKDLANKYYYPIDGVVFKFNSKKYSDTLGKTEHHFNNAIAFKFYDEEYDTELIDIDYDIGRTGVLTPVAVYKDIDIEGSICNRASLHNLSIMKETLGYPYKGQKIKIYKSNMIIPQISWSEINDDLNHIDVISTPTICPICGGQTKQIESDSGTITLICDNNECNGKLINKLDHFCSKNGLDIKGLSEATLEKLIEWGWIDNIKDIFNLNIHRNEWIKKPGFGPKSVDNILVAIENSKKCELDKFICAIGIPLIGNAMAKELAKTFTTWENFIKAVEDKYKFWKLKDFGLEIHNAIMKFNFTDANELSKILNISSYKEEENDKDLNGLTFVITGKVNVFKNRNELKNIIESRGGKVSETVSKNTNYLINNDIESTSSKNLQAKKLKINIITEKDFLNFKKI